MTMNRIVRGGLAGLIATVPMTLVIAAGRVAGLLRTPPPKQITANVEASAGIDATHDESFTARWMIAHAAYGAGCGVLYAVLCPRLPGVNTHPLPAGLAFGGAVWTLSYCAVMPALGVYPWPRDDDHSRAAVMIVAHGVFGVALAAVSPRLAATPK